VELLRGVAPAVPDPAHDHDAVDLGKQRKRIRDGGDRRRATHAENVAQLALNASRDQRHAIRTQ
jgi:hypothetical protein